MRVGIRSDLGPIFGSVVRASLVCGLSSRSTLWSSINYHLILIKEKTSRTNILMPAEAVLNDSDGDKRGQAAKNGQQ